MINIQKLNKTYDRGRRHANHVLHDISLELPETGFVCILGPSGCGKTSLLNAIGGLDRFDSGVLATEDVAVDRYGTALYEAERNRSFGYIFQNYYLLMDHSVAYNVYLGLHSLELSHKEKLKRVRQALEAVEMGQYLHRTVGELSGGQQQRVAIARALARKPRVIFADEPTGNLDEANTLNICTLLRTISKTSLVVMVTHEERIANFFADRIIRLDQGRVVSDSQDWNRGGLSADSGKTLYAGDYRQTEAACGNVTLRVLTQEGAAPVELTVLALTDRVVIKLADSRAVTCGSPEQSPVLKEGARPVLTLETLEQADFALVTQEEQKQTRAGKGISFSMMAQEALRLSGGRDLRQTGMRLFLVLLTVLLLFTVSDYLTVAAIDPEDFITSDSHMLELNIKQGSVIYPESKGLLPMVGSYLDYLKNSGQNFIFVPHVAVPAQYSVMLFKQMDAITLKLMNFSYVPMQYLGENTLLYGRMPENSNEIVVDRWVLDAAAATDGIIQNSITDASYFLGAKLRYEHKTYAPTIVGISDCGQPAVFVEMAGLISLGVNGVEVTPLSELREKYPGQYDDVVLTEEECIVILNNAGMGYATKVGGTFSTSTRDSLRIHSAIEADVGGRIVVEDEHLENILWDMVNSRFWLYCEDKAEALSFLKSKASDIEQKGYGTVEIRDRYSDTYALYAAATSRKADARTIVTVTVMLLSMVMLYLLCRARTQSRLGMLAVYRLLGIPGRKLALIFAMESLLTCLITVVPSAAAGWLYITVAARIPEMESSLLLPWQGAVAVGAAMTVYHLLVSLEPLWRLLRLPPAQLAAKYDM